MNKSINTTSVDDYREFISKFVQLNDKKSYDTAYKASYHLFERVWEGRHHKKNSDGAIGLTGLFIEYEAANGEVLEIWTSTTYSPYVWNLHGVEKGKVYG